MPNYIVVLAIAVVILLVPQTRQAALQVLGVLAIAAVGIAGIVLPIWALYEAKPLLPPPKTVVEAAENGAFKLGKEVLSAEREADRRRLEEERQAEERRKREEERQAEEQWQREEEQRRIASLAESARAVVERDRTYASVVASSPRLSGADQVSVDLITIRIPGWRDNELAEREKGLISLWLQSIGLTAEETASIHTANAWGSVYDLWRKEHQIAVEMSAPVVQAPAASEPEPEPTPPTELEIEEIARGGFAPPAAVDRRPETRPEQPLPRRRAPVRRPASEREVGPFGY